MSEKVRRWYKLAEVLEEEGIAITGRMEPSPDILVYRGARSFSFYLDIRRAGKSFRNRIEGEFDGLRDWKKAQKAAEDWLLDQKKAALPVSQKPSLRSEEVWDTLVSLKKDKDPSTYQQIEIFVRVHLKPFMNGQCPYTPEGQACPHKVYLEAGTCPYAQDFSPPVWLNYKAHIRLHKPGVSLFNHWKFFVQFAKYLFEQRVIEQKLKLPFDEKKEDNRARGFVIPDEDFRKMIAHANTTWRDRMIIQRLTGQRPGLVRELRKDRLDLAAGILRIQKQDSKNRRSYEFVAPAQVVAILERRLPGASPFFFPSETDPLRPMDKHLTGWRGALKRAGVNPKYTPHDLRHTRLTELFKTPGINHALTCYQHDLSLDEAMRTYIHFEATDTRVIAEDAQNRAQALLERTS